MQTEKNLVEEALIQMKQIEDVLTENAKGILSSTMKQEIEELVKESLNEQENDFETDVCIYPNPTDGNFSIDLGGIYETINISISDAGGKLIQAKTYTSSQILRLKLDGSAGIYVLVIESGSKRAVVMLAKE